jgi:ATP-binding cassette subfamily B (MDR/TAP) protein 1
LKKYEGSIFGRLFAYNKPDIWLFITGTIGALANGAIFPLFSLYLAKMISILTKLQFGIGSIDESNFQALVFLILAFASFFASLLQTASFNLIGDRLTQRIRVDCYNKILKMPIPWFDIPRNNAGSLSARLATDCQVVNGLTSNLIGVTLQNVSCLVTGITIAFCH